MVNFKLILVATLLFLTSINLSYSEETSVIIDDIVRKGDSYKTVIRKLGSPDYTEEMAITPDGQLVPTKQVVMPDGRVQASSKIKKVMMPDGREYQRLRYLRKGPKKKASTNNGINFSLGKFNAQQRRTKDFEVETVVLVDGVVQEVMVE